MDIFHDISKVKQRFEGVSAFLEKRKSKFKGK